MVFFNTIHPFSPRCYMPLSGHDPAVLGNQLVKQGKPAKGSGCTPDVVDVVARGVVRVQARLDRFDALVRNRGASPSPHPSPPVAHYGVISPLQALIHATGFVSVTHSSNFQCALLVSGREEVSGWRGFPSQAKSWEEVSGWRRFLPRPKSSGGVQVEPQSVFSCLTKPPAKN